MMMKDSNYIHSDLTDITIKAFYNVYNKLGYGFLEKVYERAMLIELKKLGLNPEAQKQLKVYYDEVEVGDYYADLMINDSIIVEPKAAETIVPEHEAQLVNYLRATNMEVGLLLNFGKKPQMVRRVLTNDKKNHK
jgi:GxxExxY protein